MMPPYVGGTRRRDHAMGPGLRLNPLAQTGLLSRAAGHSGGSG